MIIFKKDKDLTATDKQTKYVFWRNFKAILLTIIMYSIIGFFVIGICDMITGVENRFSYEFYFLVILQYSFSFFPPLLLARLYMMPLEVHYKGLGKIRHANYISGQIELFKHWHGIDYFAFREQNDEKGKK